MAQLYANSSFTGSDMIDVFAPYVASAPKNCSFVIANTLKGLPFPDDTFDYVFQRMQVGSFRELEWPEVYAELVRVTKRGGWVELIDTDGRLYNSGPAATAYDEKLHYMFGLRGINMACISHRSRNLENAGLESVVHKTISVPVGWGGDIGAAAAKNTITSYKSLRPVMLVALGLGEDEYSAMTSKATAELLPGTTYKTYWNAEVAYGRKPELADKIMIE
ncbi:hypothetical protein BC938DRAFT_475840 [Jimgerdemannia flammicorona]|nr:hypothetical protein BC938DRAFT_475840 [Jimgerdemannia flammicorona]